MQRIILVDYNAKWPKFFEEEKQTQGLLLTKETGSTCEKN